MAIIPSRVFSAIGLTNSDYSIDKIPTNYLKDDDVAIVWENQQVYFYKVDFNSGLPENIPEIIKPFDATIQNSQRWILYSHPQYVDNLIITPNNFIQFNNIHIGDGFPFTITSENGQTIYIDENGIITLNDTIINGQITINNNNLLPPLIIDSTQKVVNLNADLFDGFNSNDFVLRNGTLPFTATIKGIDPIDSADLTTKSFVENITNNIIDSTQNGIINIPDNTSSVIIEFTPITTSYNIIITIENTIDITPSIYNYIITNKTNHNFEITLDGYTDSANYKINWMIHKI